MLKGPKKVNEWREREKVTVSQLAADIGDEGRQVSKWLSGNRPQIPLNLITAICNRTGLSVWDIATAKQQDQIRRVVAVVAQDVEWPGDFPHGGKT